MAERILYNLLQVFVVLTFAPLVEGVLNRLKENLQSKRGPSIYQLYRDIWKYLHKDEIVSEHSSSDPPRGSLCGVCCADFRRPLDSCSDPLSAVLRLYGRHVGGRLRPCSGGLFCDPGRGRCGQSLRRHGGESNSYGRLPRRTRLHRCLPDGFIRGRIDHPLHRSNPLGNADRQLLRTLPHPIDDCLPNVDHRRGRPNSGR